MSATVAVLGTFRFPPERINDVLPHLKAVIDATNRLDGCIAYDAALDPFEPGLIRFSELWPDRVSLERHLAAPHMAPWRAAVTQYDGAASGFTIYEVTNAQAL